MCPNTRMCAAFAKAVDAEKGPVPPERYWHHYYHETDDEIVYSSGFSSEGEPDALDPSPDPNEEDWVSRYHDHVRRRAADEVGPIISILEIFGGNVTFSHGLKPHRFESSDPTAW